MWFQRCLSLVWITWISFSRAFFKKHSNLNHRQDKTTITSKYNFFEGNFFLLPKQGYEAILTTVLVCTMKVSKTRHLGSWVVPEVFKSFKSHLILMESWDNYFYSHALTKCYASFVTFSSRNLLFTLALIIISYIIISEGHCGREFCVY